MNDFYNSLISKVNIERTSFTLQPDNKSFFIGSCFSNNLQKRFNTLYLDTMESPFGNIYNPISLASGLMRIIENRAIIKDECFIVDGLYQHFDFYSKLGCNNLENYISKINKSVEKAHHYILNANMLVITLGTAGVYEIQDQVVNNCHKLPSSTFNRKIITMDRASLGLTKAINKLKKLNPKINIILTLSPVRHLRDTATENSLSKATLRVAIDNIIKATDSFYFPSYEIILDELRDYRWFTKDLSHPTEQAIEYVVSKFLISCQSEELKTYIKRVQKINNMRNHIIIHNDSDSTKKFIKTRNRNIKQLKEEYPFISL
ncbi:MAG: hypothetical protein B6229_01240 [Spirochaetaceae bacterium 4572_7]|nr:MAG: hypothetical protein B6229_01240 [Spirochaetaceae bacterium 4572_7]